MTTQAPPELMSQYRAMREGSALLEPGSGATVRVSGPDAVDFLQGQVTNDVAALEPGSGCYALLLNPKGRILAEMRILMRGSEELLVHSEQEDVLPANLTMYSIGRDVAIEAAPLSTLSLIGPHSARAVGIDPPAAEHAFTEGEIEGVPVIAVRTRLGIDVLHPSDRPVVREALRERVTGPVPEEAAEIVRIESGRPRYGRDMSEDNLPGELGLEQRAISFTKGCYVGQEPVARMYHRGHPNRHLRGLRLAAPVLPGQALHAAGKQVGAITSSCVSPALGPIALALVRREVQPGSVVRLSEQDGAEATVSELPFDRDG